MYCCLYAAVTDIDTSGIHALEELNSSLKKRDVQVKNTIRFYFICLGFLASFLTRQDQHPKSGVKLVKYAYRRSWYFLGMQLVLANPGPAVIHKLHASNFANLIGEDRIFLTVADAVSSCSPKLADQQV